MSDEKFMIFGFICFCLGVLGLTAAGVAFIIHGMFAYATIAALSAALLIVCMRK